jgi:glycosyltransferase involved in cell wall biosynthesis
MPILLSHATQNDRSILAALGSADYSYHFVHEAFRPVLASLGMSIALDARAERDSDGRNLLVYDVRGQADAIFGLCRRVDEPCVLLSFTPPHEMPRGLACPTIPVFAWEFQDIPNEVWDGQSRHDWSLVLREAGAAVTHSTFAADAVRRAMGETFPVAAVPAPVWDRFAALSTSRRDRPDLTEREVIVTGTVLDTGYAHASAPARASARATVAFDAPDEAPAPLRPFTVPIPLDGCVFTAIFNPNDGRKNWQEMLRAFCIALRDAPDATLVLKLIGPMPTGFGVFADNLERLRPFCCRVVMIDGFLDEASYERLLCSSTFIVNASAGEGQCLPLMQAMSAGVPAVAPDHTAMAEYVDATNAFVVASTREPCAWPHDPRGKYRTLRHRPDVESLMDALRAAHAVATRDSGRYRAMSEAATARLRAHCSEAVVREKLRRFLPACWGPTRESGQPGAVTPARDPG